LKKSLIRISKILSHSGICSRKNGEDLIINGLVKVNGKVFKGFSIEKEEIKEIKVKNKLITKQKTRAWCFYKPKGFVCSNNEQFKQKSFFRLLPKDLPRVISVGRLDIMSEGLLVLTNSPSLSTYLEKPINKIKRTYFVKVKGEIPGNIHKMLESGITIDGIIYDKINIEILKDNCIKITLIEGKNREIRKILEYFNLNVISLKRSFYGPFKLNLLKPGDIKEIKNKDLNIYFKILKFKNEDNFWQT